MVNDKKKRRNFDEDGNEFEIFQFTKLAGIRGADAYDSSRFVSPIFGKTVKDEITTPKIDEEFKDTGLKYDAFRDKPKIKNENYHEFRQQFATQDDVKHNYSTSDDAKKISKKSDPTLETLIAPIVSKEKEKVDLEKMESAAFEMPVEEFPITEKPLANEKTVKVPDFFSRIEKVVSSSRAESNTISSSSSFESLLTDTSEADIETPTATVEHQEQSVSSFRQKDTTHAQTSRRYQLPSPKMFKKQDLNLNEKPEWMLRQIEIVNETLLQFNIDGRVENSIKGPTVTRYELELSAGVNVKRVASIQDNLMMNLAVKSIRIEAPIPGKPYVGIEVPNEVAEIVYFGNVVDNPEFLDSDNPLKIALGVDIDGKKIYADITKMPHGLIAGATNSGKSVAINTILASLLIKNHPDDLKLILIDPKMVELTPYNDIPHLITPVITDPKLAASALTWAVDEMEKRYKLFASSRSRDIKSFNQRIMNKEVDEEKLPYILIIIDELADLMMVAAHEVEDAIQRLTQKARAAGIHLLVATQRPTTDVVKGTIKSNIPTRIAFRVASFVDSTTIIDGAGAESLLGRGDMLLKEDHRLIRLQGAFISDDEVYKMTDYIRSQMQPNYQLNHEELFEAINYRETVTDELFEDVAYFVVREQNASINSIQKEFSIGFNRAQALVDSLEQFSIVSASQGTRAREVLVTTDHLKSILGHE